MAAAPRFKLYNSSNEYVGALKYAEDAAALVAFLGDGATIRDGHAKRDIVWHEGKELFSAGESYDNTAENINKRTAARYQKARVMLEMQAKGA